MKLSRMNAETIAEKLHDFNPNLNVMIKPGEKKIVATIPKLEVNGEQLKTLGEIAGDQSITFDRTGGKLRMIIA